MQDIDLKAFKIPGFHLEENCTGNIGEVFYVSDASEDDSIEIIPDCNNDLRSDAKIYIILYLKDCQTYKAESFYNDIEDPEEAFENMNKWIRLSVG